MSLDKEAAAFISGRHKQFNEGLGSAFKGLDQYIRDNLYNSTEKEEALKNLIEVQMWAERCAKMYGIK